MQTRTGRKSFPGGVGWPEGETVREVGVPCDQRNWNWLERQRSGAGEHLRPVVPDIAGRSVRRSHDHLFRFVGAHRIDGPLVSHVPGEPPRQQVICSNDAGISDQAPRWLVVGFVRALRCRGALGLVSRPKRPKKRSVIPLGLKMQRQPGQPKRNRSLPPTGSPDP
jgi:hypothetical protein